MSPAEIIFAPRTGVDMDSIIAARLKKLRPWQVVHACDFARDIADVVEAQLDAGMRPYLLTVGPDAPAKASILQAWQDVRRWKKALDESGAHTTPELVHAHSFAAGMAAARLGACLVYDLRLTMETRLAQMNDAPGAWLTRSFRTAEQFVLSRASAVVVHCELMREECIARGVAPQDVFLVPDPMLADNDDMVSMSSAERAELRERRSPQRVAEMYDDVYRYAFARRRRGDGPSDSSGALVPIPSNI